MNIIHLDLKVSLLVSEFNDDHPDGVVEGNPELKKFLEMVEHYVTWKSPGQFKEWNIEVIDEI